MGWVLYKFRLIFDSEVQREGLEDYWKLKILFCFIIFKLCFFIVDYKVNVKLIKVVGDVNLLKDVQGDSEDEFILFII